MLVHERKRVFKRGGSIFESIVKAATKVASSKAASEVGKAAMKGLTKAAEAGANAAASAAVKKITDKIIKPSATHPPPLAPRENDGQRPVAVIKPQPRGVLFTHPGPAPPYIGVQYDEYGRRKW